MNLCLGTWTLTRSSARFVSACGRIELSAPYMSDVPGWRQPQTRVACRIALPHAVYETTHKVDADLGTGASAINRVAAKWFGLKLTTNTGD